MLNQIAEGPHGLGGLLDRPNLVIKRAGGISAKDVHILMVVAGLDDQLFCRQGLIVRSLENFLAFQSRQGSRQTAERGRGPRGARAP